MSVKFLYNSVPGRMVLKVLMYSGVLKVAGFLAHRGISKPFIKKYIKNNGIDMSEYPQQQYKSFADFFGRVRPTEKPTDAANVLLSPCDSMLNVFPIDGETQLAIKGSLYKVSDLIPDEEVAEQFRGGICFIFRLRGSDYHHFWYIDDCEHVETHFIKGKLHSVQPIACERYPVYRLNRRQWTLLKTDHFGPAVQIEVGALLVGGMIHEKERGRAERGEEMGRFDLAGSTVVVMFDKNMRDSFVFDEKFKNTWNGEEEIELRQGERIGELK